MSSLKLLKNRIKTVKSIKKVTKAMQMIAASRFRQIRVKRESAQGYITYFYREFYNLLSSSIFLASSKDLHSYIRDNIFFGCDSSSVDSGEFHRSSLLGESQNNESQNKSHTENNTSACAKSVDHNNFAERDVEVSTVGIAKVDGKEAKNRADAVHFQNDGNAQGVFDVGGEDQSLEPLLANVLIVVSSDKGLCGSFNSTLNKVCLKELRLLGRSTIKQRDKIDIDVYGEGYGGGEVQSTKGSDILDNVERDLEEEVSKEKDYEFSGKKVVKKRNFVFCIGKKAYEYMLRQKLALERGYTEFYNDFSSHTSSHVDNNGEGSFEFCLLGDHILNIKDFNYSSVNYLKNEIAKALKGYRVCSIQVIYNSFVSILKCKPVVVDVFSDKDDLNIQKILENLLKSKFSGTFFNDLRKNLRNTEEEDFFASTLLNSPFLSDPSSSVFEGKTSDALSSSSCDSRLKPLLNYEPCFFALLKHYSSEYLKLVLYDAILQSMVSEHSSRMTAMDNANRNSEDLLELLQRKYNKGRQSAITSELAEIISGMKALSEG